MCMLMLSCFSRVWLFVTPWTVGCQAPLSMGFSRWEYWSGLPRPSPGDLPDPGIKPVSLMSLQLAGGFFTTSTPGEPNYQVSNKGIQGFSGGSAVKNPPAMQETQVQSLGWEDPLEKEMATVSSILAWKTSWTEEPGWLQSVDSHHLVLKQQQRYSTLG